MLVLSRQRDETIMIGDDIEITIVDIRGDKVRLGITAPTTVPVHRKEVYESIKRENREASRVQAHDVANLGRPANSGPPATDGPGTPRHGNAPGVGPDAGAPSGHHRNTGATRGPSQRPPAPNNGEPGTGGVHGGHGRGAEDAK